ncbi:MAG: hypothetical protein EP330_06000 [Deltaproteobacteria bacterium]|nr:MAG: hypothetical protein EP330_06000 [Deltaproteobacteria bacterium]
MSGGGARPGVVATIADWEALGDDLSALMEPIEGFDDADLADLTQELLAPSEELGRVSRRIAAQYAEVVASFAASAFAGRANEATLAQVEAAVDALRRLADASGDTQQDRLLGELWRIIGPATTGRLNSRARQSALVQLREWIPRFADTLEAEDAERLIGLVEWDSSAVPLLDELATLHGIGPRRLQRLYAAGLHNVSVVAAADPQDVAEVTGLPRELAARVVAATREYAFTERRRCLEGLRDRALRLRNILDSVPLDEDGRLHDLAADALREVEATFQRLHDLEA